MTACLLAGIQFRLVAGSIWKTCAFKLNTGCSLQRKKNIYIYIFTTYSSLFNSPLGCHQTHYSWADVGCDGSEKHPMQGQVWDIRARSDYEGARPGLDCLTHHLILLSPNQHVMIMDGLIKDIFLNYENGSDSRLFNAASKQTLGADT